MMCQARGLGRRRMLGRRPFTDGAPGAVPTGADVIRTR